VRDELLDALPLLLVEHLLEAARRERGEVDELKRRRHGGAHRGDGISAGRGPVQLLVQLDAAIEREAPRPGRGTPAGSGRRARSVRNAFASARGSSPSKIAPASPTTSGPGRVGGGDGRRAAGQRLDEHEPEGLAAARQRGDVRLAVGGEEVLVAVEVALHDAVARRTTALHDEPGPGCSRRTSANARAAGRALERLVERCRAQDRRLLGPRPARRERRQVDPGMDDVRVDAEPAPEAAGGRLADRHHGVGSGQRLPQEVQAPAPAGEADAVRHAEEGPGHRAARRAGPADRRGRVGMVDRVGQVVVAAAQGGVGERQVGQVVLVAAAAQATVRRAPGALDAHAVLDRR
jgi:hypothetical protein